MENRDPKRFLKLAREFYRLPPEEQRAVFVRAGVFPELPGRGEEQIEKPAAEDREKP